ncbi:GNAT family N-acetyltransferase [Streptomyces aidingensis]|uniref:Ribosomal protein S18 acetylase RimI n=1 Tax=Streptomyces aidingensis TaxID=910347 RepID=A0A1I1RUV5_9ACTN|nr:GNAT family N-acetyltransferase [Streptomyces aidingensis]SFD38106.1 Ribosomal protein S18 acetylase RimI [Streptomyces aidingensis]
MTTTLRPTGPEERDADGTRSRAYAICVNGRPVGEVRLAARWSEVLPTGRVERLTVEAAYRGRGRATVAALAAEEVLRTWGCRRIEVRVPAGSEAALGLARALGYTETGQDLGKRLAAEPAAGPVPAPPAGAAFHALTGAEFAAWRERDRIARIRCFTAQGLSPEAAAERAGARYARLLPQGPATPGAALRALHLDGTPAGTLWAQTAPPAAGAGSGRPADGPDARVHAVEVAEEYRRRGFGRLLLAEAERLCRAAGGRSLALALPAGDTPALRLATALGYRAGRRLFAKPLL